MEGMMTQQHNDISGRISPTVLFDITGKFGKDQAIKAMNKAGASFVLALRDMGGRCPDNPAFYSSWAMGCGLPQAKSFALLRNVLVTIGWVIRAECSDGHDLILTEKGRSKAVAFELNLKPKDNDDESETEELT